jgi:hypothetical protein
VCGFSFFNDVLEEDAIGVDVVARFVLLAVAKRFGITHWAISVQFELFGPGIG